MEIVEADEIRVCVPTAACLKFWATIASCMVAMGLGTFLMIWGGEASGLFKAGEALLAAAAGVLIPGPEYHKVLPKKKKSVRRRRRVARRSQSAAPAAVSLESRGGGAGSGLPLTEILVDSGGAAPSPHSAS